MSDRLELPTVSPKNATLELLRLALPIMLMTVSRMLMGFVDFVMVSQLGTAAQAAISPATLFVFVLACIGLGIATAVQTFVAQSDGRGEPRQAGAYAWQPLYLAGIGAVIVLPFALTTSSWFGWIARAGAHTAEVAALEVEYIRIALWTLVPAMICVGLESFFNGIQRPRVTLLAVVVALVVNALGNWVLIFGHWGAPPLGVTGAAIATLIGWWVRAGILTLAILQPSIDERFNTRHALAFCWPKMAGLLRVGGPTAVQWLVDIGSWAVFMTLIMPPLGLAAMAATNIGIQLMHLSFMPAVGVGIALCSQVGFAIGERKPEQAVLRTRTALRACAVYMGLVGLLFWLARRPLIELFNDEPAVVAAGSYVLIWAAVFQVFDAMGITYSSALRGAGDTRWPAMLMAVCCWGVFIGGGVAASHWVPEAGLNGPWAMCTLYIILVGLGLGARWHRGAWRRIRLFDEQGGARAPVTAEAAATP